MTKTSKTTDTDGLNKSEIRKSQSNIRHWLENYYHIETEKGMKCGADIWYPKNIEALVRMSKGKCPIICGSRNIGKTTILSAFALWNASLFMDHNILIGTAKSATALSIIEKIYNAYQKIPDSIKPKILKHSKTSITFETGSTIYAKTISIDVLRKHKGMVLLDEFAYSNMKVNGDFFKILPSVCHDSMFVMASSYNERDNLFQRLYDSCDKNHKMMITWEDVPQFANNANWKNKMIKSIGDKRFSIDYDCKPYESNKEEPQMKNTKNTKNTKNIKPVDNDNTEEDTKVINEPEVSTDTYDMADIDIYDIARKTGLDKDAYMFDVLKMVLNLHSLTKLRYNDVEKIKKLCEVWLEQNTNE